MSEPNLFVSNGTCYSAAGQEADDAMIPCGNDYFGRISCCQQGDWCLSSNACYNDRFGVTYLSGCSDPEYEHDSCPDKGEWNEDPWVGLVYCNGTSEEWVACGQEDADETLTSADHCWCPETSRTVAFTDASRLTDIVLLPTTSGGSVVWQAGHVPTVSTTTDSSPSSTPSPTGSDSGSASGTPTTSSPGSDNSVPSEGQQEDQDNDGGSGLGLGASLGIGFGVGAFVVLFLVAFIFCFVRHRRRKRREEKDAHSDGKLDSPRHDPSMMVSEIDSQTARPWSFRSELDANQREVSEMEAAPPGFVPLKTPDRPVGETRHFAPHRQPSGPATELPA